MDYFHTCEIEYQPESLYYDISKCIGQYYILYLIIIMKKIPILRRNFYLCYFLGLAHATFHAEIRSNPNLYLHKEIKKIKKI